MTTENNFPADTSFRECVAGWQTVIHRESLAGKHDPEKLHIMALMAARISGGISPRQLEHNPHAVLQIVDAAKETYEKALKIRNDADRLRWFGEESRGNKVFDQRATVAAIQIAMKEAAYNEYDQESREEVRRQMLNEYSRISLSLTQKAGDFSNLSNAANTAFLLALLDKLPATESRKVSSVEEERRMQQFALSGKKTVTGSDNRKENLEMQRNAWKKRGEAYDQALKEQAERQQRQKQEEQAQNTYFTDASKKTALKMVGGGVGILVALATICASS